MGVLTQSGRRKRKTCREERWVDPLRPRTRPAEGERFVCVCCRPIYSGRRFSPFGRANTQEVFISFVFVSPPSFCGACLFFLIARRVQHSLSLVDREVECCVPATKSLSTVGCCARKNPRLHRDLNPRPNRQKVTRLPTEPPGRPVQ